MTIIDIGNDFSPDLINRDEHQRDGKFTGVQFREKYLSDLTNIENWKDDTLYITLDFKYVQRLGPSWANEVFAFFTRFADLELILKKIQLTNISTVKKAIIENEIKTGYKT